MTQALVIRGGTVVNADREQRADVLCVDGRIVAVGDGVAAQAPAGAQTLDASGQYVLPGGIDPHTHMQLPFMGTVTMDDFFTGTSGSRMAGGTTTIIDFVIPDPQEPRAGRLPEVAWLGREVGGRLLSFHVAITWWDEHRASADMGTLVQQERREQLQALHGLQKRHHVRRRNAGEQLQTRVWSWVPCPPCTPKTANWCFCCNRKSRRTWGIFGPEGHPLSPPAHAVEGEAAQRAIAIANVLNVPIYVVHVSMHEEAAERDCPRPRAPGSACTARCWPGTWWWTTASTATPTFATAAALCDEPAFPREGHTRKPCGAACNRASLHTTATDHCTFCAEQKAAGQSSNFSQRSPTAPAAWKNAWQVLWDAWRQHRALHAAASSWPSPRPTPPSCSTCTHAKRLRRPWAPTPTWCCGTPPPRKHASRSKPSTAKATSTSSKAAPSRGVPSHTLSQGKRGVCQRRPAGRAAARAGTSNARRSPGPRGRACHFESLARKARLATPTAVVR